MAAAFAIKKYLEEKGEGSGKVILYGCGEGAATKAFMARDGVFAGATRLSQHQAM